MENENLGTDASKPDVRTWSADAVRFLVSAIHAAYKVQAKKIEAIEAELKEIKTFIKYKVKT